MKKRVVGLLLSFVLSFSLIGCGSSAEPKQETEKEEQTQEQEETEQDRDIETENFVFLSEIGESEYILRDLDLEETKIEFTTQYETNIYNEAGRNVGYIKPDVFVTVTEHGVNSTWYRFENPETGTDYDYLYINKDDMVAQGWDEPISIGDGYDTKMMRFYPDGFEYAKEDEDVSGLTWEECNVEFTNKKGLYFYTDTGKNLGWLNEDVTVTFTEENEDWYRFENPQNMIDSEYLIVSKNDIETQKAEVKANEERAAEVEAEEKMYDDALALIDENKTYTLEEFHELMKEICSTLGTEYDVDVAVNPQGQPFQITLNLDGKKLKEIFEEQQIVWLLMKGLTGYNPMDCYFATEKDIDTTGDFDSYFYLRFHKEEE